MTVQIFGMLGPPTGGAGSGAGSGGGLRVAEVGVTEVRVEPSLFPADHGNAIGRAVAVASGDTYLRRA
jgi:hypothetical protein